jgi:tetratricopeptide (TPR) repeat protein/AraC-like DNA-binding protein
MTLFRKRIQLVLIFIIIHFCLSAQTNTKSIFVELKSAKHDSVKARLYYELGKKYKNEFPDSAIFFYKKSIDYADKSVCIDYKVRSSINLGRLYDGIKLFDESKVLYQEALRIDEKLGNLTRKHIIYTNLTSVYFNMGNLDSSKYYVKEAINIAQITKDKDAMSRSYLGLGGILDYEGKPDSAILYYKKGIEVLKEIKNDYLVAIGYNNIGSAYSRKGDYQKSIVYFKKAVELAQISSSNLLLGSTYRNIGLDYTTLSEYDRAIQYYRKALQTYKQINNQAGVSACYEHIGSVYFEMEDYKMAHDYYEKCLEIQEGHKDYHVVFAVQNKIGELYQKQKDHKNAEESFNKALEVAEQSGVKHYMVFAYINIGNVSAELGDYKKSIRFLEKALADSRKSKFKEQIGKSLLSIAEVQLLIAKTNIPLIKQYQYIEQSIKNSDEALKIFTETEVANDVAKTLKNLAQAYELKKDYEKALHYNKQYNITRDSIMDIEKYKTISELEIKYQIEQKELKIQKQDIELKKKQQSIQFYIIALLMLLIGIFFISWFYRKKRKAFKKLAEKNIEAAAKCTNEESSKELYEFSEKQQEIFKKLNLAVKNDQVYTDIELTIDSLAKILQTNRTELSLVLKKFSDKTYPVFINEQRIKHAIRLLVDYGTKYSIDGIAKESGFKSTSNFYKIFKEHSGMTPAEFQKSSMT